MGPTPLRRADAPHGEIALFAGPRNTNPDPALTPLGHPVDLGCAAPDSGSSTRITPKAEEGEEDDIPFSIKQSFKELRSVKDELERQVRTTLLTHSHLSEAPARRESAFTCGVGGRPEEGLGWPSPPQQDETNGEEID